MHLQLFKPQSELTRAKSFELVQAHAGAKLRYRGCVDKGPEGFEYAPE